MRVLIVLVAVMIAPMFVFSQGAPTGAAGLLPGMAYTLVLNPIGYVYVPSSVVGVPEGATMMYFTAAQAPECKSMPIAYTWRDTANVLHWAGWCNTAWGLSSWYDQKADSNTETKPITWPLHPQ